MEAEHRTSAPRSRPPRIVLRVTDVQKFREQYLPELARGGVFVKSEKLLPGATTVDVELHPPGWDHPLPLRGRIERRVEPGGSGPAGLQVAFETLGADEESRLAELIAAFAGAEDPAAAPENGVAVPPPVPAAADDPPDAPGAPGSERAAHPPPVRAAADDPPDAPDTPGSERAAHPPPVPAAADPHDAFREAAELRGRLAAAEAALAALRHEFAAHERDEAATRALAERLAVQKNRLDRQWKQEAEAHARLREELDRGAERLLELEARVALAERRAEEERAARDEAGARLAEWRRRTEEALAARNEADAKAGELARRLEEAERLAEEVEERSRELGARLADEESAGRIARERALELERLLEEEQAVHAAERDRLLEKLAEATARAEEAEVALERVEARLRDSEERLGETRARAADLDSRLADAEGRLGHLRAREQDLRRLLALVSDGEGEEGEEPSAPADLGPARGADPGGPDPRSEGHPGAEEGAVAGAAAPAPEGAREPDAGCRDDLDETRPGRAVAVDTGAVIVAADLLAEAGLEPDAPSTDGGDIPLDLDLEEPPPGRLDFESFRDRLETGDRVRRTEAFRRFRPVEPSEIRLGNWLVQADSLQAIRELAGRQLAGDRLPRLLFHFYRRELLELAPAPEVRP